MDSAKCPECGTTVRMPIKSWVVRPRKGASFLISLYECPKCLNRWRVRRLSS